MNENLIIILILMGAANLALLIALLVTRRNDSSTELKEKLKIANLVILLSKQDKDQ